MQTRNAGPTERRGVLLAALAFSFYAMHDGWRPPSQRVEDSTHQCRLAMTANHIEDALAHCLEATQQTVSLQVRGLAAGNAFGQLAVLHMAQRQPADAARACRLAIAYWRAAPPSNDAERDQARGGITRCLRLLDDTARGRPKTPARR